MDEAHRRFGGIIDILKLWFVDKVSRTIVIAMFAGAFIGGVLPGGLPVYDFFANGFLRLVAMLVAPLIFFTLVNGVARVTQEFRFSSLGGKTLLAFLITTLLAIIVGLVAAKLTTPWTSSLLVQSYDGMSVKTFNVSQRLQDLIPFNIVDAFLSNNAVHIAILAVLFGWALVSVGEEADQITRFCHTMSLVFQRLIRLVMALAPLGVAGSMAALTAQNGWSIVLSIFLMAAVTFVTLCVHFLVIFYGAKNRGARSLGSPGEFLKMMGPALSTAGLTASSYLAMDKTMRCLRERFAVPAPISGFVVPLGTTMNMNGTAIYLAILMVWIADALGMPVQGYGYIETIGTVLIISVSAAGLPGGSGILFAAMLAALGAPTDLVAIVFGIDRIFDMMRTTLNVAGDSIVTVYISDRTKEKEPSPE